MKLTALKDYRGPAYPTQDILRLHPELLRVIPRRWHNNAVVLGTLAGLLAVLEQSAAQGDDKATLHCAPIFVHGTGVGAFGCVAVSPPVFLTEAEAQAVIEQEAKSAGVELGERGHKLTAVELPVTDEFEFLDRMDQAKGKKPEPPKKTTPKKTTTKGDLKLNGWNDKLQIGYKFVAQADFIAWEVKDGGRGSSVSEYNILGAAKRLQSGLGVAKEPGHVAVFYEPAGKPATRIDYPKILSTDPTADKKLTKAEKEAHDAAAKQAWETYHKEYDAAAKKAGEEELRGQVRDFIAWLKAQGVI